MQSRHQRDHVHDQPREPGAQPAALDGQARVAHRHSRGLVDALALLVLPAVEEAAGRGARELEEEAEAPGEGEGVAEAGGDALTAERGEDVGGVADDEGAVVEPAIGDFVGEAGGGEGLVWLGRIGEGAGEGGYLKERQRMILIQSSGNPTSATGIFPLRFYQSCG